MSKKLSNVGLRVGDLVVCASIVFYVLSFFLRVLKDDESILFGYEAFFVSLHPSVNLFVKGIPPILLWIANITWLCGTVYYFKRQNPTSLRLAICSVLLASLRLGDPGLMVGYYTWVASMYLLLIGILVQTAVFKFGANKQ